ncbi:MAG: M48 family metallopeptidase [Bacilli bacterium]|nr:M48 family metallopeptidase [Bacilli bacterium]
MKYKASNGLEIEYEIIRKKNKNVYFRVKEDLKLYITAPIYISGRSLLKLIEKNEESILKMYEKQESKSNEIGKYRLLGETYYVEIKPDCEEVTFVGQRVQTPSQEFLDMYTKEQIDKVFGSEIELCKKCFASLPEFTWKARYMKTRWGVCNMSLINI